MDAAEALADLCEVSGQLVRAAILEAGTPVASTINDPAQAALFAARVGAIIEQAELEARSNGMPELARLELATREGSVFAVRDGDWVVAATARADATPGLILYDLGRCLESVAARPQRASRPQPATRRRPPPEPESDGAA